MVSCLHPTVPDRFLYDYMLTLGRMNRRKADFKFAYKFLEDDI